jgi:hypothetical protein
MPGSPPRFHRGRLEAKSRPEGTFQVILAAVVEIDFVADLQAQPKEFPEAFNAASRVQSKSCVTDRDCPQRTGKSW